jgi:lysophospholipase L1-like esterase
MALSDPVDLPVADSADVLVSYWLKTPVPISGPLPGGRPSPDHAMADGDATATTTFPTKRPSATRPLVSAIDVRVTAPRKVVVALGDSITDGDADASGERGWPGALSRRLAPRGVSVVNAGVAGNRLLSPTDHQQRAALARLDSDVLLAPGITHIVVLEGINDIQLANSPGAPPAAIIFDQTQFASGEALIDAYRQIISRAHARGVKVLGGTIIPFGHAPAFTPEREAVRRRVNAWIRTSGAFDGVIDFEAIVRDPAEPTRIKPELDSGDHLHPNSAGYRAMGEGVDPKVFD